MGVLMVIVNAAADALASAVQVSCRRLENNRGLAIAVIPSKPDGYFHLRLVKVPPGTSAAPETLKRFDDVRRDIVPIRIKQFRQDARVKDAVIFLQEQQKGGHSHCWQSVDSELQPTDVSGEPIIVSYTAA